MFGEYAELPKNHVGIAEMDVPGSICQDRGFLHWFSFVFQGCEIQKIQ